jgi:hypothetical protein
MDLKTAAFIREMPSAGVSSIDKNLEVKKDGNLDLYMGTETPKVKEGIWILTAKGQQCRVGRGRAKLPFLRPLDQTARRVFP